jgi:hypothetical protein
MSGCAACCGGAGGGGAPIVPVLSAAAAAAGGFAVVGCAAATAALAALRLARRTAGGLRAVTVGAVGVASSVLAFFLGDSLGILARYGLVVSVALGGERAE